MTVSVEEMHRLLASIKEKTKEQKEMFEVTKIIKVIKYTMQWSVLD